MKRFCTARETINRVKKTTNELGESICKPYILQLLISQIYKEYLQLNSQTKKKPKTKQNKQTNKTWLTNGQSIWIDISPKETYKWPTGIWKDAEH